ncbi:MAG: kelch repeat-containing protein [Brevinematales bacterium]
MIGGSQDINYPAYNDVWNTDGASPWVCVRINGSSAPFSKRMEHTSLVFNNNMWIIAGESTNGSSISNLNDVCFNLDDTGSGWACAASNAAFPARHCHTSVVFKNTMWVIGGYGNNGALNDVWYAGFTN